MSTSLSSYAEIATGIIVGCLPILPKFFKHCITLRSESFSDFKRLPSSVSLFSWRRLFRRSTSRIHSDSNEVGSPVSPTPFGKWSKKSEANPQQITTLNLTRASLDMTNGDTPQAPTPAYERDGISQTSVERAERDEDWVYGEARHGDLEKAIPTADTNRNRLEKGREALQVKFM